MDRSSSTSRAVATMLATAAVLAALVCAPVAWGAPGPLSGGATQLNLDRGLERALQAEGVAIEPLGPAKLKGRQLTLPVASGSFDPEAEIASFAQSGGLKLVAAGKTVALRRLRLDAQAKALNATIAGKRLLLAHLGGAKSERAGFDAHITARRLPLTRAGAAALNRVLDLPAVLRAGRSLGSVNGLGEPAAVQIDFGSISIGGPDTSFSKLESLQVQMGIWGATQRWSAPGENFFVFDLEPTAVSPDASEGILAGEPNDGVTMQIHASPPRDMLLRGPRIDLASRELSATVSPLSKEPATTAAIATLDYGSAEFNVRPKVGAFELMGIRAISNQFMADRLNERFATNAFAAGETLARISVTLHAR